MRVVVVGTGKIASGYLAPLLAGAGWEVALAGRTPSVVERIARAKAELPEALPRDGLAVLNADDPRVLAMRDVTAATTWTSTTSSWSSPRSPSAS